MSKVEDLQEMVGRWMRRHEKLEAERDELKAKLEGVTLESLMAQIGDRFRGLWTSYMFDDDNVLYQGWSVTVEVCGGELRGKMVETTYRDTAVEAMEAALKILTATEAGKGA